MQIDSKQLSQFIKAVLSGISEGLTDDYSVATSVKFKIGLKSETDKQGNVRLTIVGIGAGLGAKRSSQEVASIEFEVDDMVTVFSNKFESWSKTEMGRAFIQHFAEEAAKLAQAPS